MDYKRAILAALITYGITLVAGIVAALFLGIGFEDTQQGTISPGTWIFGGVTSILAAGAGSFWYFKKEGTVANIRSGFHLGLVIILLSFALDWLTFLPVITDPKTVELIQAYYGNAFFWVVVILVMITAIGVAKYYEGKKDSTKQENKSTKNAKKSK